MIPNKNLQDDNDDDLDIGEENNVVEHNLGGYVRDSHFIPSEDQGGDTYKQELISKLLQSGRENEKKKKPNINEISNRLYQNKKLEIQTEEKSQQNDTEKITDFKKATAMLSSQLEGNKELDIINDQMAQDARNYKANEQSIHEGIARQKDFLDNVNKKREMLKSELAQKEMSECSFKPVTNSKTAPRKLKKFLSDQSDFLEKTKSKIEQMAMDERNKKESEFKANPSISRVDKEKAPGEEPAYERLFKLSKNNKLENQQEEAQKYVPAIEEKSKAIKRTERIDVSLYNDALRRQIKQNEKVEVRPVIKSSFNQKSEECFAHKLIKQLIRSYNLVKDEQTTENNISLNILNDLLISSGFMKININDEAKLQELDIEEDKKAMLIKRFNEEKNLILEMWTYLEADQGLSLENIRIFLCAIQNLMCAVPIENEKKFNDKHELILSAQEAIKIRKQFDAFNLNRLHFTEQKVVEDIPPPQHMPQINAASRSMVEAKRPHESLAQLADKMTEVKRLKNEEMIKKKQDQDDKILENCTFTPSIVAYVPKRGSKDNIKKRPKNSMASKIEPSKDRCEDLFKLSQQKRNRKEKTKEEYDMEKNKDELTFAPNISVSTQKVDNKPVYAKNIEDTINRLAIARKQTEIKKQMLSRGEPNAITTEDKPFVCVREKQTKFQSTFDGIQKTNAKPSKGKVEKTHKTSTTDPSKATAKIEEGLKKTLNDFRRSEKAKQDRKKEPKEAPKKASLVDTPMSSEKVAAKEIENPIISSAERNQEHPAESKSNQMSPVQNPPEVKEVQEHNEATQESNPPQNQNPRAENEANPDVIKEESEEGSPPKKQSDAIDDGQQLEGEGNSKERVPLLYIDVNIGPNESERLEVYEGDTAEELSRQFAQKHSKNVSRFGQSNGKQVGRNAKPAN